MEALAQLDSRRLASGRRGIDWESMKQSVQQVCLFVCKLSWAALLAGAHIQASIFCVDNLDSYGHNLNADRDRGAQHQSHCTTTRTRRENPPKFCLALTTRLHLRHPRPRLLPASDVTSAQVVAAWWPFSLEQRMASRPCWSLPELEGLCGLLTAASGRS